MIISLAVSFFATLLYYHMEDEEDWVIEEHVAWKVVGGLSGGWLFFFALFLGLIKHKYWRYVSVAASAAPPPAYP
jgi:hypothetical protein